MNKGIYAYEYESLPALNQMPTDHHQQLVQCRQKSTHAICTVSTTSFSFQALNGVVGKQLQDM